MSMAWTTIEDETLREALRLNPNVGAAALEDRVPIRSRGSITKRLRRMRGTPSKPAAAPQSARSAAAHSKLSSTPLPPRGYYPAEIEWAKATAMDKTARLTLRWEAAMILGYHAGRR